MGNPLSSVANLPKLVTLASLNLRDNQLFWWLRKRVVLRQISFLNLKAFFMNSSLFQYVSER